MFFYINLLPRTFCCAFFLSLLLPTIFWIVLFIFSINIPNFCDITINFRHSHLLSIFFWSFAQNFVFYFGLPYCVFFLLQVRTRTWIPTSLSSEIDLGKKSKENLRQYRQSSWILSRKQKGFLFFSQERSSNSNLAFFFDVPSGFSCCAHFVFPVRLPNRS